MVSDNIDSGAKDIMQAPDGARTDPEFSHILTLAELKLNTAPLSISANEDERALLAIRFDLPEIHSLSADVTLSSDPIHMKGQMRANIDQLCVATGETINLEIFENIAIDFIETPNIEPNDSEIELEDGDCETIFHNGREIDIGEAVAQSLYLAIDPFPRVKNAEKILAKAGVITEEEMAQKAAMQKRKESPFNALSALKK